MEDLQNEINLTIHLPDFLSEQKDIENIDEIIKGYWKILNTFWRGVNEKFLSNTVIRNICMKIDWISDSILDNLPQDKKHIHLQSWIWIGNLIEIWIELAVLREEYETATNLRRILNSEYA